MSGAKCIYWRHAVCGISVTIITITTIAIATDLVIVIITSVILMKGPRYIVAWDDRSC